ncbi:ATP/GTP-binding protein [Thermodesulfobacteriota bacterium]
MALINPKKREIQIKLIYYGPGRGGKTTNLKYIYNKFRDRMTTELMTVKTYDDRTLFFDFMPLDLGVIKGYNIKIKFYTVPGQVKYKATRRLVLRGVDGVIFVADSMVLREKLNSLSLKDLQENLAAFDKNIFKIPLVMQYNKRDLEKEGIPILPVEKLEKTLNRQLQVPSFPASATTGENVVETMKTAISLTVSSLKQKLDLGG